MDPLEPWIDASAARRLAENLLTEPRSNVADPGPDAGFGADFVGFAMPSGTPVAAAAVAAAPVAPAPPVMVMQQTPPPPVEVVRPVEVQAPAEQPTPAPPTVAPEPVAAPVTAVAEQGPPPVPAPAAATPANERRGPLLERLARFRDALIRHTGAQGVFILDREGKPVMEDPAFGKLHFLARSLAQAYRPVSGQAGNVHVKIGSNAVLEVVPVDTPFGCLVLGTVMPRPLTAAAVAEIAAALRQAAKPRDT